MSIVKDCGEIWSRLFDHQPFIQKEVNTFVKEFEEKRSDREVENLLDVLNIRCEISDLCDRLNSFPISSLESLNSKVESCKEKYENILNPDKAESKKLVLLCRRQEREQKWQEFKKSMEPKYIEVDVQFRQEQNQIKKFYEDKEKDL